MKYIEWLNIWLNNYIKPSAKERTYIRYEPAYTHAYCPENRRYGHKQPYTYRFTAVCNIVFFIFSYYECLVRPQQFYVNTSSRFSCQTT